ncbi:DUF177 domain-containing protein [Paenibacillus sp. HB172176]|uniref:YceD family protein n=1 Tax=Paenibacillus sp. HB172176 TaxID=2493690 RepID=UPI001439319B|nr:DUF177 domain-containing protein [Paenibacillus sp. HB172176]
MQFRMQEMMNKGLKATLNEKLDVSDLFKGRGDVYHSGPLHVSLEVTGHEGYITAEGMLTADLELACSRCLEPVKERVSIPFFEQFAPAAKEETDGEAEEAEADNDFVEVAGDRLNLLPYLEEALQLFMPFAPLCDQNCKGLCQTCGQNLNEKACGCNNERVDVRFAALKDFFKE